MEAYFAALGPDAPVKSFSETGGGDEVGGAEDRSKASLQSSMG